MANQWAIFGVFALSVACGVSCSGSAGGGAGGNSGAGGTSGASEAGSGGGNTLDCSALSIAACASAEGCGVLRATLKSLPPHSADEAVGCAGSNQECSEVNITARDPQGREWSFPDTCIPAGWVGEGGAGDD
jgi:hypothetical protein